MKFYTRTIGSQRTSKPRTVTLTQNWGGQGGFAELIFFDGEKYYIFKPESVADVKELMSKAHIVALNYGDEK